MSTNNLLRTQRSTWTSSLAQCLVSWQEKLDYGSFCCGWDVIFVLYKQSFGHFQKSVVRCQHIWPCYFILMSFVSVVDRVEAKSSLCILFCFFSMCVFYPNLTCGTCSVNLCIFVSKVTALGSGSSCSLSQRWVLISSYLAFIITKTSSFLEGSTKGATN